MSWLSDEVIEQLYTETTKQCTFCKKDGIKLVDNKLSPCDCLKDFDLHIRLTEANIPRRNWEFDFRYLSQDFKTQNAKELKLFTLYITNIEANVLQGNWLLLQGGNGLAKSAICSYICRVAIQRGFKGHMIRLSHLTEILFNQYSDPKTRELVRFLEKDVQLVVVDEMDKDSGLKEGSSAPGSRISQIFGDWYDRKVSVIMVSNVPKSGLKLIHSTSVMDRVNEAVDIVVTGESFRKKELAEQRIASQIR